MAIEIDHPDAERLAEKVAELTAEPLETAVLNALRERLERAHRRQELDELFAEVADYPVLGRRTPQQIISFDQDGPP